MYAEKIVLLVLFEADTLKQWCTNQFSEISNISPKTLTLFGSCRDIFVESNNFSSSGVEIIVKKFLENLTFIFYLYRCKFT